MTDPCEKCDCIGCNDFEQPCKERQQYLFDREKRARKICKVLKSKGYYLDSWTTDVCTVIDIIEEELKLWKK